jgi:hypothetical protein
MEASHAKDELRLGIRRLLPDRLETAVLFVLAVVVAYQLFVEPIVGIADNRDFARLMDPAGLDYTSVTAYREHVFQFVETKFAFVPPSPHRYLTSQRPIVAAAKLVNGIVAKDDKFDLRVLGLCNLALYLAAVAIFLRAFRPRRMAVRLFVSAAVLLMCPDVKWVSYFNSFYCESASLVFLFSTLGLALLCIQGTREGATAWLLWFGFLLSGFLFWMAKSQNTAFAPCLAVVAFYAFPRSQVRGRRYLRLLGTAAVPVGVVWTFLAGGYGVSVPTNAQVVWAEEIAPHSTTLVEDARQLRLERGSPTLGRVALFYVHHPVRWWRMAERQTREAFGYPALGNFTRSAGFAPKAQSLAFGTWGELKKAHFPRSLLLLVCLFLAYVILASLKARRLDREPSARRWTMAGPLLALGCALELVVVVTFEANGTTKHFFIFNAAVDLCLLMAILGLGESLAALRQRRAVDSGRNLSQP